MTHTSFLIEAINDLIQLNETRITNYTVAAQKMDNSDPTLKDACLYFILEGKQNIKELHDQLYIIMSQQKVSHFIADNNIFELWKDLAEKDTQVNIEPSFAACVCSEDAVQQVYDETLFTYSFMPAELRAVIIKQKKNIAKTKKIIMNHLHTNNRAVA